MARINKLFTKGVYFFVLLSLIPCLSFASDDINDYVDHLLGIAESKRAWQELEWINLIHYQSESSLSEGLISQVDDPLFFKAINGKTDPEAELKQTLISLFSENEEGDAHAQCKFVARLHWLKDILNIDVDRLPEITCSDYIEWRKVIRTERVTLVFPAYHLNSPSSMFGHTLLRLDPEKKEGWSEWLSFAVNFGANIQETDDSLAYAFKGLTGGYPGIFIVSPYYKKIQEYNRIEHRDIWEYELNLTAVETERMVKHLWELKDINFDYYFFDENCSYRLLELLEVARPGLELTDEFTLTAIPVDTVRVIKKHDLIKEIQYRPSQITVLKSQLDVLSEDEVTMVKELSETDALFTSNKFLELTQAKQKLIIKSAYQYLRYTKTRGVRDEVSSKQSYRLLKQLNTYPSDLAIPDVYELPSDPVVSHDSRRINLAYGVNANTKFGEIGYKFSFHDLIDNEIGFLRGAQINIFSMRFRSSSKTDLFLERFDLVDIFSLTPRTHFFTPLSWKVITGLERQRTNGSNELVAYVSGGAGVSYALTEDSQFHSLITARLENNDKLQRNIEPAIGLLFGSLFHFDKHTLGLELKGEQFRNNLYRVKASYEHNFVIDRNNAFVLKMTREWQESDEFNEASFSYQRYF